MRTLVLALALLTAAVGTYMMIEPAAGLMRALALLPRGQFRVTRALILALVILTGALATAVGTYAVTRLACVTV